MKSWICILAFFFSFSLVKAQLDDVFWEQHNIHQIELDIENDQLDLNNKRAHYYNKTNISDIIQQQVEAYNSHDLEAFLSFYSDSIEAYLFPDSLLGKGKEIMEPLFKELFDNAPNLHVEIINMISFGDYFISEEVATGMPGGETIEAVEIYKVENNLITKVWFIYK